MTLRNSMFTKIHPRSWYDRNGWWVRLIAGTIVFLFAFVVVAFAFFFAAGIIE